MVRRAEAERESAVARGLRRQRLRIGMTAVPISTADVAFPMSATAVSASSSSGICGTQIAVKPAASADRAAATSRTTLSW
jgi:hypothetical protein